MMLARIYEDSLLPAWRLFANEVPGMSPSTCLFGPEEPFVLSALALPGTGELGQDRSRA